MEYKILKNNPRKCYFCGNDLKDTPYSVLVDSIDNQLVACITCLCGLEEVCKDAYTSYSERMHKDKDSLNLGL